MLWSCQFSVVRGFAGCYKKVMNFKEALALWNTQWRETLPLSEELIEATFMPSTVRDHFFLETKNFLILCKVDGPFLRLHLALPKCGGLTSAMMHDDFAAIEKEARARRCEKIIFGGGEKHIFPGVPAQVLRSEWLTFLEVSGPEVHDFIGDLQVLQSNAKPIETYGELKTPRSEKDEIELVEFIEREFPGRWAREALQDQKNKLLNAYFAYHIEGVIAGYVRLYGWLENYWAPGVYFAKPAKGVGGLGPIGVAASQRRKGIGAQILKLSWDVLLGKRCSTVRIDWTTEVAFYEQRGLKLVQTYQPAVKIVARAAGGTD